MMPSHHSNRMTSASKIKTVELTSSTPLKTAPCNLSKINKWCICVQKNCLVEMEVKPIKHGHLKVNIRGKYNVLCIFISSSHHHCYLKFSCSTDCWLTFICSFLGIDPNIIDLPIDLYGRPQRPVLADVIDVRLVCLYSV